MFEGKERRKELIQELRHTHALQAPEQKIQKEEEREIMAEQAACKRRRHKVSVSADFPLGSTVYVPLLVSAHS